MRNTCVLLLATLAVDDKCMCVSHIRRLFDILTGHGFTCASLYWCFSTQFATTRPGLDAIDSFKYCTYAVGYARSIYWHAIIAICRIQWLIDWYTTPFKHRVDSSRTLSWIYPDHYQIVVEFLSAFAGACDFATNFDRVHCVSSCAIKPPLLFYFFLVRA